MSDYAQIKKEFTGHPYIKIEPIEGNPPERYLVTYHVKGLRLSPDTQRPVEVNFHQVEIYLHSDYPREKPRCFMRTEIFHPNFSDWVCIGDFWASGEGIVDVIFQIGEMIQYRQYNVKSPLNGIAAKWVKENEHFLPVGYTDLYLAEPVIEFKSNNISKEQNGKDFEIELK